VRALTEDGWDGGVEFAFEATGIPACIEQAVKMLSYGGTATTIGFPAAEDAVTLNLGDMATGVYWNKAGPARLHCGDALPSHDFRFWPSFISMAAGARQHDHAGDQA
jgi:S-(hydroxymethyl)mycothiol dehydrogenase